jgi:hypothetical protein
MGKRGAVIVLKYNRPLSADTVARIRLQIDNALKADPKILVVDDSVEVYTDNDGSGITFMSAGQFDALDLDAPDDAPNLERR